MSSQARRYDLERARSRARRSAPTIAESLPQAAIAIAEAASRAGVSVHTLRYHERAGLVVNAIDRSDTGRRRYHRLDLEWIGVCTRLRATGRAIKVIGHYADLARAGHDNEQERLDLMQAHRADVITRIAELQANLELVTHKIDAYQGRLMVGDADKL